jgi:uncharacterized membrane protein
MGLGAQVVAQTSSGNTMMQNKTKKMLTKEMPSGFEKCYGIAKAGQNDCASGSEACAGQSKTDGQKDAWLGVPSGTCAKIVGGSTTEGSSS